MVQEVCPFCDLVPDKKVIDITQHKLKITLNNFIYKEKTGGL